MTAVIGILNKHGVALAADSAVTRTRGNSRHYTEKCTKNGNKMLRLSNVVPVAVMITGNADFLCNPWDVIIRRYRQERGNIQHPTVELCVHDLFEYISQNDQIWNDQIVQDWIGEVLERIFNNVEMELPFGIAAKKKDGSFAKPQTFIKAYIANLKKRRQWYEEEGICPHFKDYSIEKFHDLAGNTFQNFLDDHTEGEDIRFGTFYPKNIVDAIKQDLEKTLMLRLITRYTPDNSAQLIFSGYGIEEEYPTLISVNVCEGFDRKVNYMIRPGKDIVHVSDSKPVAICPFAQRDVADAILTGMHESFTHYADLSDMFYPIESEIFELDMDKEEDREFASILNDVKVSDLRSRIINPVERMFSNNVKQWEKLLENYDLKAMASLAESLIDLTGFHRILTFQQEGVGGPVDVAVITKNDGFTWLSRKSWYHHKDVNGSYGSLGI